MTNTKEILLWEPIPVAGFSAYEWSERLGRVRSWRVSGPNASNRASCPQELVGNLNSEGRRRWKLVGDSGKHKDVLLQKNLKAKLSQEAVLHIRNSSGSTTSTLAREFGVSLGAVRDVRKGVTWKHNIKENANAQC